MTNMNAALVIKGEQDDSTEIVTKALGDLQKSVDEKSAKLAERLDKLEAGNDNGLADRIDKVEAKLARKSFDGVETKSIGQQFVETEGYKAFAASNSKGRASLSLKAITTAPATVGAGTDGSTSIVPSHHVPGILQPAERALTIRGLLASGSMDTGVLQYVKETGFTNAAAIVAEGVAKPYSDITFNQVTQPAVVIAHMFKASKQVLEDSAMLASYIDTRARYGLASKEEDYLLNDSTSGLLQAATTFDTALVAANDNKADLLRRAILQVRKAEYRATGIVMNPTDWADIEVLKETTGGYIWSNPTINNGQNLWGLPVVDTTAIDAGEFLVGAFSIAAQIFDRWQARVEVSTENDDDFEKNLVSIRAEERLALAIFRPESFVHGEFDVEEEAG